MDDRWISRERSGSPGMIFVIIAATAVIALSLWGLK